MTIGLDEFERPYVKEERLRYRAQKMGRPLSLLNLSDGKGYAFEGEEGSQGEDGSVIGNPITVELNDTRKLGIVTLGAMKQYSRIEKFLSFLKS